jgi:hypothetical protein
MVADLDSFCLYEALRSHPRNYALLRKTNRDSLESATPDTYC